MLGELLVNLYGRRGFEPTFRQAIVAVRAVRPTTPFCSFDTVLERLLRRNPADPLTVALRVCNAESATDLQVAFVLLSLFKAAGAETGEQACAYLRVAGEQLEAATTPETFVEAHDCLSC